MAVLLTVLPTGQGRRWPRGNCGRTRVEPRRPSQAAQPASLLQLLFPLQVAQRCMAAAHAHEAAGQALGTTAAAAALGRPRQAPWY